MTTEQATIDSMAAGILAMIQADYEYGWDVRQQQVWQAEQTMSQYGREYGVAPSVDVDWHMESYWRWADDWSDC